MNTITGMTAEQIDQFCENMRKSLRQCLEQGHTLYLKNKLDVDTLENSHRIPFDAIYRGQTWIIKIAVGRPAEKPALKEHMQSVPIRNDSQQPLGVLLTNGERHTLNHGEAAMLTTNADGKFTKFELIDDVKPDATV